MPVTTPTIVITPKKTGDDWSNFAMKGTITFEPTDNIQKLEITYSAVDSTQTQVVLVSTDITLNAPDDFDSSSGSATFTLDTPSLGWQYGDIIAVTDITAWGKAEDTSTQNTTVDYSILDDFQTKTDVTGTFSQTKVWEPTGEQAGPYTPKIYVESTVINPPTAYTKAKFTLNSNQVILDGPIEHDISFDYKYPQPANDSDLNDNMPVSMHIDIGQPFGSLIVYNDSNDDPGFSDTINNPPYDAPATPVVTIDVLHPGPTSWTGFKINFTAADNISDDYKFDYHVWRGETLLQESSGYLEFAYDNEGQGNYTVSGSDYQPGDAIHVAYWSKRKLNSGTVWVMSEYNDTIKTIPSDGGGNG